MSTTQKVIKYLAIAFAIFLTVTIISAIIGGIFGALKYSGIIGCSDEKRILPDLTTISDNANKITSLKMKIKGATVRILKSDKFEVKTNVADVKYKNQDGKIEIIEDRPYKWYIGNNDNGEIIVYMPEDQNQIENVDMKVGAGKIKVEKLNAKNLSLDLGAGELEIDNLTVSDSTKINGGAGNIEISSGKIANLKSDLGVGQTTIKADVTGDSKIDTGVGELNLYLTLKEEDYTIDSKKGLGEIKFNNNRISNDTKIGTGQNYIKIEGGVGKINITTN